MPTMRMRLSSASFINGASSWQGTHHDAQTLTSDTAPLKSALAMPGTGAPSRTRPATGGSGVSGTGRPISADGSFDGSPAPSRNRNSAASARNAHQRQQHDQPAPLDRSWIVGGGAHAVVSERRVMPRAWSLARGAASATVVQLDPDQRRDHHGGDRVGCDDETGVRTEVHWPLPGADCACISISARTRRRRISLPMAATCSVRNNSVNASAITSSGIRMVG